VDLRKLKKEQLDLAKKVSTKDEIEELNLIAGCNQSFVDYKIISSIVVLDFKTLEVIEEQQAEVKAMMPYIPGFLSYRETPAVIEVFNKLENRPDVLLVEANGILHPRKLGMASHLGLSLDIPTIGVAKKLLCGEVKNSKIYVDGELRGMVLVTKEHANPLYISPGHKVNLKKAMEIIKQCIKLPHKLPEPLHLAHRYAKRLRKKED